MKSGTRNHMNDERGSTAAGSVSFVRCIAWAIAWCGLTACVAPPPAAPGPASAPAQGREGLLFSSFVAGAALPADWEPLIVRPDKNKTAYSLVIDQVPDDEGNPISEVVLHAEAISAASGLMKSVALDLARRPSLRWRWKLAQPLGEADGAQRHLDDYPLRIVLTFDGDRSKLPLNERIKAEQARFLTGRALPYATLIYVWDPRRALGQHFPNSFTDRIRTLTVQRGVEGWGVWHLHERDVRADYLAAYGEPPGRVTGIGVMTDTDNTRGRAKAFYGDIEFVERARS